VSDWQQAVANSGVIGVMGEMNTSAQEALLPQYLAKTMADVGPINNVCSVLQGSFFGVTPCTDVLATDEAKEGVAVDGNAKGLTLANVCFGTASTNEAGVDINAEANKLGENFAGDFCEAPNAINLDTLVQQLMAANVSIAAVNTTDTFAGILEQAAATEGYKGIFVGGDGTADDVPWQAVSAATGKGYYALSPYTPPEAVKTTPAGKAAIKYGTAVGETQYLDNPLFSNGWVAAEVVFAGLRNAGKNITRSTFITGLTRIKNLTTGLAPEFSYGAHLRAGLSTFQLLQYNYSKKSLLPVTLKK
jgi:ABC-type branched-subunit amino acid transport system substrate-binding protein